MNSDGVSLPTTIAQLGSVAKTQSRAQQQAQNVTPFKDQLDKREELKVQRVKQTEAADHRRIEAEDDAPDKRQRRRRRRERKLQLRDDEEETATDETAATETESATESEKLGALIDLRA